MKARVPTAMTTRPEFGDRLQEAKPAELTRARSSLGTAPALMVIAAGGLAVLAVDNALARSASHTSQPLFWLGILTVVVPIFFRLLSGAPSRTERIVLVVLLGLALYLVKVIRDPFDFTFADEFPHVHNANEIVRTGQLFNANPILPITPKFPGLEGLTSGLSDMSGLSTFGAGLLVIAVSRLIVMLALFLLFERLSGSPRLASLGAAIYVGNYNFLFFSAQFSYESLALPLFVMVLALVAEYLAADRQRRPAFFVAIILTTFGVVVTHHLTAYVLVLSLTGASLLHLFMGRSGGPWPFAVFAIGATTAWLLVVASITVGYLTPVFVNAFTSTIHTLLGEAAPRQLLGSGAPAPPLIERATAFGSVALLVLAVVFGVRIVWRRHQKEPFVILFLIAAVAFFALLGLRFAPAAWETANRSSEFLFVGLAFVVAYTVEAGSRRRASLRRPLLAACFAVVVAGGVIGGWPRDLRLAQPYRIKAGTHVIEPEGYALARWAAAEIGPGRRFAATDSDARLLTVHARETIIVREKTIDELLRARQLTPSQVETIRVRHLRYIVVDRRLRSFNNLSGYFFGVRRPRGGSEPLLPLGTIGKFERRRGIQRLYDSGTTVVFDVGLYAKRARQ